MASQKRPVIGFIGQGWIGKNYADDFERRGYRTVRYSLEDAYVHNKDKIRECEFVFIAVPTPTTPEGFDDSIVRASVGLVGQGKVAVIKSTIVPGTTQRIQREYPDRIVMYSPEFLSEATAAHDTANPFANIVGITDHAPAHKERAERLHAVLPRAPFKLTCSSTEAEIVKYSHNGSGYTQVVFFNLMYDMARTLGCDWKAIQRAIEADPMVSSRYSRPIHKSGRGAGGHCFIKDVAALRSAYERETGDATGVAVLRAMEKKNTELLHSTGKDLDLLSGVYGEGVLREPIEPFIMPQLSSVRGDVRLLLCTEAVDRADPLLGYMHDWVAEFARHAQSVTVLTLGLGERHLPPSVTELSLGKGTQKGPRFLKRSIYSLRLLRDSFLRRKEYDDVLVHLSSEFAIVGAPLWKLLGKRMGFWYNDAEATVLARIAASLSDVIFYSHPDSYVARYPHARRIPTGVDTDAYASSQVERRPGSLLFLGRIAPQKRLDALCEALLLLDGPQKAASLDVYGEARQTEEPYAKGLRARFGQLEREGRLRYRGSVPHEGVASVYAEHDIFVNAGSMRGSNKTLYEAMAAGCLVVSSERELRSVIDQRLFIEETSPRGVAAAISNALALSEQEAERERAKLKAFVHREHALSSVVPAVLEMLHRAGGQMHSS